MAKNPPEFRDSKGLTAWLRGQSWEISAAIATRTALRILPLCSPTLFSLRANFIAWAARKYPRASISAADAALALERRDAEQHSDADRSAYFAAAATATTDIAETADAAAGAADGASGAATATSFADAADQIWDAITADAQWLMHRNEDESQTQARALINEPLWLRDVRGDSQYNANFPPWARAAFDREFVPDDRWQRWVAWYRAILPNSRTAMPKSAFGESVDITIATQPSGFWNRDSDEVMVDIDRIVRGKPIHYHADTEAPDHEKTGTGPYDRPAVWLAQCREGSRVWQRLMDAQPGSAVPWKIGNTKTDAMRVGDPVVYWRTITKGRDRGGIIGTGRIVSTDTHFDENEVLRVPTEVVQLYDDNPLGRDEVIKQTDINPGHWGFSLYQLPVEVAERMDALVRENHRKPLFEVVVERERADLGVVYDRPESEADYLGRSDLALLLAIKLNQAWEEANQPKPPANGAETHARVTEKGWRSRFERARRERIRRDEARRTEESFIVHVNAPWGGGKTTFANFLAHLLNPYVHGGGLPDWPAVDKLKDPEFWKKEYRKPWICVQFNAWQHQHVSPPWWCFYQAIRHQAVKAMTTDCCCGDAEELPPVHPDYRFGPAWKRWWHWLTLNTRESLWRLTAPKVRKLIVVAVIMFVTAYILYLAGFVSYKEDASKWAWDFSSVPASVAAILVLAMGGLSALWGIVASFTDTLLPGTPDAARNYEMGSGDPLERFRTHFARMIQRLRRPVLVIIDDLDRCEPHFVVEFLRGIQTILRSPRVVFLILGDRDWIEQAFSEHHKAMKGIDVGPEHSFGARFVEKAIQLSLVLPGVQEMERTHFVHTLLAQSTANKGADSKGATFDDSASTGAESQEAESVRQEIGDLSKAESVDAREEKARALREKLKTITDEPTRARFDRDLNRESALLSAADRRVEEKIQHQLVPLAPVLPSNPRQIKRIINGLALFQEIARLVDGIQPGTDDWRRLAQWVVLMTEYPQTWFTLSHHPGLVDEVLQRLSDASVDGQAASENAADRTDHDMLLERRVEHWAGSIAGDANVHQLVRFDGWDETGRAIELDSAVIQRLRIIMPATSGSLLPDPPTASAE